MSPDNNNNNMDDLDFSDLDLDDTADAGFDDEAADTGADDGNPAAPAKKSSMMFYAIAGVVVIGVVVLGLFQFGILGGSSRQPYTAENAGGTMMPGGDAAMAQQGAQPGTSDPFNVMGTPDQLPADQQQNAAPTPADQAAMAEAMTPSDSTGAPAAPMTEDMPVTSVMPGSSTQDGQTAAEGSTIPMPAPVGDNVPAAAPVATQGPATETPAPAAMDQPAPTVMETAMKDSAAPSTPAQAVAEAAQTPAATPAVAVSSSDMSAIMDRLDAIEKRLDAQQSGSSASPAMSAEVQDLKAAVARLENPEPSVSSSSSSEDAKPAPKKAAAKKPAKKKTTAKKAAPKSAGWDKPYDGGAVGGVTASSAPAPSGSAAGYSLRAAQPGVAWVSDANGTLQEVRVGDTLPGIGRVNSISQSGGAWSVNGQSGRLSQ